jgi:hypothetical protein
MNNKNPQEEYKYNYWVMTVMSDDDRPLPEVVELVKVFRNECKEYTFQLELTQKGLKHYQCCMKTKIRKRQSTLLADFVAQLGIPKSLITIDRAQDYEASIDYCSDSGKREDGTIFFTNVARLAYDDSDIKFLDSRESWYKWQIAFMSLFFDEAETNYKTPDDRSVYWITDEQGNSGKSKFVKWLYCRYPNNTKVSFGSATQLRTAVVEKGPKEMYILDIPRTLAAEDSIQSVISVIEDIKNGFVETCMHGNPRTLLMNPPHVVVIANTHCPQNLLTEDRWKTFGITRTKELSCLGKHTVLSGLVSNIPKS